MVAKEKYGVWVLALLLVSLVTTGRAEGVKERAPSDGQGSEGWPMWRYDSGRTAAAPSHVLPDDLELRWVRELPAPKPAYPLEVRLRYDVSYEPVALNGRMFVPSMVSDSVTALDIETGEERWRFFAEAPVRFAPLAWEDRVYFVADDGYLYCLDAADGRLEWKFHGVPSGKKDRRVMGHERLMSVYPARGGPVLKDGVIYFAAGLWPGEGVAVHAVDARNGETVWSNADIDNIPESNWDHGVGFRSGLTPEGYLAVVGDWLVVPCGYQLPAFFNLQSGELHTYTLGWGGRCGQPKGTWFVAGVDHYLSHGGDLFDITRPYKERVADPDYGQWLYPGGWTRLRSDPANHWMAQFQMSDFRRPVLTTETLYESGVGSIDPKGRYHRGVGRIVAHDLTSLSLKKVEEVEALPEHRATHRYPDTYIGLLDKRWEKASDLVVQLKAGDRLFAGGNGVVEALSLTADGEPVVVWSATIDGMVNRMFSAEGKLFAVTRQGRIYAFGAPRGGDEVRHTLSTSVEEGPDDAWRRKAPDIQKAALVNEGYALVMGIDNGRLVEELVRQSELFVIAIDQDAEKVEALRERLHAEGLYGTRASVLVGAPAAFPFPPYFASIVVTEAPERLWEEAGDEAVAEAIFRVLRPYGGMAFLPGGAAVAERMRTHLAAAALEPITISLNDDNVLVSRLEALPGAADWSHGGANAANTGASKDTMQPPFSMLWFTSHRYHKHPGQHKTRISGGRMIMLEAGLLRAIDIYTGRVIWETTGVPIGENVIENAGRRAAMHRHIGSGRKLATTTQFVVMADAIYVADGRDFVVYKAATGEALAPITLPEDLEDPWANVRVEGDYLVGSSGSHVLCVDRHTGELLWRSKLDREELSLALGNGKVFCSEVVNVRRGEDETRDGTTRALDVATGEVLWKRDGGAMLRYSPSFDVLVTPVAFYRGADGARLTRIGSSDVSPESERPGRIAGDKLITEREGGLQLYGMPSGDPVGERLWWNRRGCTASRPSANLLTTRYNSNSAWLDLESGEFTPFLGVRPGCQGNNNMYPAGGVFNMPAYSGGCNCNFSPMSMGLAAASAFERNGRD